MPNNLKLYIRHSDISSSGQIMKNHPWRRSHSLLKQFAQILLIYMSGVSQTIKSTDGASQLVAAIAASFNLNSGTAQTWGLQIGTGENAVTREDFILQAPAVTSINYLAPSFEIINGGADDWHILIHRAFTNNSAATINVKEIGLTSLSSGGYKFYLLDRTLYNLTLGVAETKVVTYKIQI